MIKKTIATLILVLSITSQIVAQGGGNLKKLNLSEEQKTKLTEIRKKNLAAIEAVKAKNITEAEKEKEIEEIKKSQKSAVKGILTPDQIAQMKGGKGKGKMKGKGKDKPNEDKEEVEKENDENDLDENKEDKKKAFSKAHKEKIMDIKADSTLTKMEKAEALKNIKKENEGKKEKIKEKKEKKEKKDKSKANKKEEE